MDLISTRKVCIAMDENQFDTPQPNPPRRRRKRSKWQNFKEAYLPVIILGVAGLMILIFIFGAVSRGFSSTKETESTEAAVTKDDLLQQEAKQLMDQAAKYALTYDYQAAIQALTSFSGDMTTIPGMVEKYNEYSEAFAALVPYTDMEYVTHLSVNMLIADLDRALADEDYGERYNRNYITTSEFSAILQNLYERGYMLVSLYDIATKNVDASGNVTLSAGKLYLPEGKKPLLLTQTGVNYFTYMVDGDGDGYADKDGSGFASRLILDANGELTCEMVDAEGNTVTGAYDLIPILNDFVERHPDFSYHGAKATIAVTGYDGLFGYRTDPETAQLLGEEYYQQQLADVQPIIEAIRSDGYDIACYTYDLANYGEMDLSEIQADLALWTAEVAPLLGNVDILVYPNGSDIAGTDTKYSSNTYDYLKSYGFCYFIGQDSATRAWGQLTESYLRQTRRQLAPNIMYYSYSYYDDLFDGRGVLSEARGEIPY